MAKYIINQNQQDSLSGENYEIHNVDTCAHLPDSKNQISLGCFTRCQDALSAAKARFPNQRRHIDGCRWCSDPCHHG